MQSLRQAIRQLLKKKRNSFLLILSLSIGLCSYILISAKVIYNRNFDTHIYNNENIYRIVSSAYTNNELSISQPRTQRKLGQKLVADYPQVKQSGFLCKPVENHFKIGTNSFTNDNAFHCSTGREIAFKLQVF